MPDQKVPKPRELYPSWPVGAIRNNELHEKIRTVANALRRLPGNRRWINSYQDIATLTGVPLTTIHNLTHGKGWPSALTIAALEAGLGEDMWPRLSTDYQRAHRERIRTRHNANLDPSEIRQANLAKRQGQKGKLPPAPIAREGFG